MTKFSNTVRSRYRNHALIAILMCSVLVSCAQQTVAPLPGERPIASAREVHRLNAEPTPNESPVPGNCTQGQDSEGNYDLADFYCYLDANGNANGIGTYTDYGPTGGNPTGTCYDPYDPYEPPSPDDLSGDIVLSPAAENGTCPGPFTVTVTVTDPENIGGYREFGGNESEDQFCPNGANCGSYPGMIVSVFVTSFQPSPSPTPCPGSTATPTSGGGGGGSSTSYRTLKDELRARDFALRHGSYRPHRLDGSSGSMCPNPLTPTPTPSPTPPPCWYLNGAPAIYNNAIASNAALQALITTLSKLGVKPSFALDSTLKTPGQYDSKTNTVTLNPNYVSSENLAQTMYHEFDHAYYEEGGPGGSSLISTANNESGISVPYYDGTTLSFSYDNSDPNQEDGYEHLLIHDDLMNAFNNNDDTDTMAEVSTLANLNNPNNLNKYDPDNLPKHNHGQYFNLKHRPAGPPLSASC